MSCFQEREEGDQSDDWRVLCPETNAGVWERGNAVRLQHVSTSRFLHSHSQHRFDQQNCPNCPIHGQQEITCFGEPNNQNLWQVQKGVFVQVK